MESTTYKFNVNAGAFPHALDIFSQFFKSPLFATDAMKREIMAVDAEDSKNRILDARRQLQVMKHLMTPTVSDYSKFSTGNVKTLSFGDVEKYGDTLAHTIRTFHQVRGWFA
jgi:secreted Zn-dependent insulinase-like peptidase